jgi:predicted membrane-bound mannosyltransferase
MLVMFAALALGALWRFDRSRHAGWAVLLGLAVGLVYATKETGVVCCAAMGAAYGALVLWRRYRARRPLWKLDRRQVFPLLLAGGVAVLVAGLFYSSFLAHPRGPLDSLLAYGHYFGRSGGDGSAAVHRQPWYYYLKLLAFTRNAPGPWWSEGLILVLAVVGFGATARRWLPSAINRELAVLLAGYTLWMTVAYALIPYKTPWNLLGFLHGLILMAGIGAGAVYHWLPRWSARAGWLALLLAGTWQLATQAERASSRYCADPRNPYVYAHPVPDVIRLARRIEEIAALHPDGRSMRVHFISPEYWPMPYYLRRLQRVGYWREVPSAPDAPVMVVGADCQEVLEPRLRDRYHTAYYGLRPDVLLLLYIRQDLWEGYLATKSKEFETDHGKAK